MDISQDKILAKLEVYLRQEHLKSSSQRGDILEVLYVSGKHMTAEELYDTCKKSMPKIGIATVYRALKLFCKIGICREILVDNGVIRYEIEDDTKHHDHLICSRCGAFVEIYSPEIEKLQKKISESHGFILTNHRLNMFGVCSKCKKK
jgi:Fur family ferric uptake transcriptional regulator